MKKVYLICLGILLAIFPGLAADRLQAEAGNDESEVWMLDNLETIGGHDVHIEGDPVVIETPHGKAIEFDGMGDGLFLDVHPLAGMTEFTAEVVFKPYAGGSPEQRFFHMQEDASESRVMFETRLPEDGLWFLDTFIKSGEVGTVLYAEEHRHGIGPWYHAAIVVDGSSFRHYVNGALELDEKIAYQAQQSGKTSLGVRLNRVHWFKGAIRMVKFTPRALAPEEFISN